MARQTGELITRMEADATGFLSGINKADKSVKRFEKTNATIGKRVSTIWKAVISAAVVIAAAKMAKAIIKVGKELIILGQKSLSLKKSFKSLAEAAGASSKKLLADMKKATRGTIAEVDLLATANKMLLLGLDTSIFDEVMEIARRTAKATGMDINYMVESLSMGLGRQSKMILDNLGIVFQVSDAYEWYAETLGKTSSQLTENEKRLGFQTYAMKIARENAEKLGKDILTLAEVGGIFSTIWSDLRALIGEKIVGAINEASKAFGGWEGVVKNVQGWIDNILNPAIESAFDWIMDFIGAFVGEDWRIAKLAVKTLEKAFGGVSGEIGTAEETAITFADTLKEGLKGAINFVLDLKLYMLIAGDILDTKLILPLSDFMLAVIPKGAKASREAWEDLIEGIKSRNPEVLKAIEESRKQVEEFNKSAKYLEENPPKIKFEDNIDDTLGRVQHLKEAAKDIHRTITYTYKRRGGPEEGAGFQFGGIIPKTQRILTHGGEAVLTSEMQKNLIALLRKPQSVVNYNYNMGDVNMASQLMRDEEFIKRLARQISLFQGKEVM